MILRVSFESTLYAVFVLIASVAALFIGGNNAWAQATRTPVRPYDFSKDLRTLPPPPPETRRAVGPAMKPGFQPRPFQPGPPDPLWHPRKKASTSGTLGLKVVTPPHFLTPSPNFDSDQPGDGPPDDNGAVGPNHYIQIVNFTFEIFDKSGNRLAGPTDPQSLWSGAPADDDCRVRGRGDPYVLYDHLADRWVITQFANHLTNTGDPLAVQCIAVSKGPNPVTDGFFAYTFQLGVKNDYPKLAVWPDGYYMISQRGYDSTSNNLDAWVFDRANMLNGNPATFQQQNAPFQGHHDVIALPSDLTGPPPPAGSPNFYVRPYDGTLFGDGLPRIEIFEFHTDWGVPTNTTFNLVQTLIPATFSSSSCGGSALIPNCVPQPGTSNKLEVLTVWPMGPLQYRNFGDHETLLFSHCVNVDGTGLIGIRWYELRRSPVGSGPWTIHQQGTFAPADSTTTTTTSIYRWMGSIAMDQAGNIALGYSASNDGVAPHPTVFPSVRVVGRLASDPPGEMTTPEVHLADGGATSIGRWGDYSAMRVDPSDGCTFWYTTEYINGSTGQQTHVGAVRFDTCNPADLAITKTAPDSVLAGGQLTYTLNVTNNGPSDATNVVVTDALPGGTIFLASSIPCSGAPLTCSIGNLANGANISFTITLKISGSFASSTNITNTASVSADQSDPDASNNTAIASTLVTESADVQVAKTCKPDTPAAAGSSAFCDIQVINLGPSDAQNVVVTDVVVSTASFTVTAVTGASCAPAAPVGPTTSATLTCNLGTLAAGVGITIHVAFTSPNPGDINDTATVTSTTPDPVTSNNSATGRVSFIAGADLSITKTSDKPSYKPGHVITYTVSVTNNGPSEALGVTVTDDLPITEGRYVSDTGGCTTNRRRAPTILTCNLGNMPAGVSRSFEIRESVRIRTGTVSNTVSVTSTTPDPNTANNVAVNTVTVSH